MEEILHQLIGRLSHYLQGFIHPRWCRISSINSNIREIPQNYLRLGFFDALQKWESHLMIPGLRNLGGKCSQFQGCLCFFPSTWRHEEIPVVCRNWREAKKWLMEGNPGTPQMYKTNTLEDERLEPTNYPFRKDNDLLNLHDYVPC